MRNSAHLCNVFVICMTTTAGRGETNVAACNLVIDTHAATHTHTHQRYRSEASYKEIRSAEMRFLMCCFSLTALAAADTNMSTEGQELMNMEARVEACPDAHAAGAFAARLSGRLE